MRRYLTLQSAYAALTNVMTPFGIQASADELYRGAIFGRDIAITGLHLVPYFPNVSRTNLCTLVHLQGRIYDPVTEEEPGRCHHEYRCAALGWEPVGPRQLEILRELSDKWGGTDTEMCYYGAVDPTPQLVRLAAAHVRYHGRGILDQPVIHRYGDTTTIGAGVEQALGWIMRRISASRLGLVEFRRSNPRGIRYQVLRDGATSFIHENGRLVDPDSGVASLDVQALAYDALLDGAELWPSHPQREAWLAAAANLHQVLFNEFWMADRQRFAMALDSLAAPSGYGLVATATSLPAELLETRLFDDLPDESARRYIEPIVTDMFSTDFLTPAGLRMRSLKYASLSNFWEYQGSHVSWVVNSASFANGLRRQGMPRPAESIEDQFLDGIDRARKFLEFFYADDDGKVFYTYSSDKGRRKIIGSNRPEVDQAWSISAAIRALLQQQEYAPPAAGWRAELSAQILERLRESSAATVLRTEGKAREAAAVHEG